jgi:trimeric autotransporter adhesin
LPEQKLSTTALSLVGSPTANANITTKELTVAGSFTAFNKVYDGSTTASFNANNLSLVGVVGTDDVSLTGEAINFADPNVANNILVSITAVSLAGTKAFNYSLSLVGSPTSNASITTKELTVAGSFTAFNKVYDGNTTASFNANNLSLIGVVGTDDVTLSSEILNFADPNVASNILVSITSASLSGTKSLNYSLSLVGSPTANANITAKELIVLNAVADEKVYDGNTAATISGAVLNGIVGSDVVFFSALTGVFAQSNAGANIPVTTTLSINGAQAGNYSLTQPQGLTAAILKAVLTVTALDAAKSYGEVIPPLHFTYSNWVAGIEAIDFEPRLMTAVNETTPAGFYPGSIIPYGALDNNYSFMYLAGDFSVGTSPLLVVANDTDRTYGAANPVFSASYVGLKNSDTAPATLPVISTVATIESPTGTYPIIASGAADPNYTISYQAGGITNHRCIFACKCV